MSLSLAKIRADPYAQRLALLGETTITTAVTGVTTTPVVDLEGLQELIAQCVFVYGSGGTQADFFLQTSFDAGTTWTDVAAFRFPGVTGRLATDFNGSSDYYSKAGDLDGNADSKLGIFSAWIRMDTDGSRFELINNASDFFVVFRGGTNKFQVFSKNADTTVALSMTSDSAYVASSTWVHLLMSWDLANTETHLYVNDSEDSAAPTIVDKTLDYTRTPWAIGANAGGGSLFLNGALAEVYLNTAEYLDFSTESNRRLFISAAGLPVPLGADGSTPTGTQPIIYALAGDASDNLGSGGDFTANGSPTSVAGPNVEDTRFQVLKALIATSANQSNQDGAMDPNAIIDGVLGDRLRVKYSTTGTFAGSTTIKIDALARG